MLEFHALDEIGELRVGVSSHRYEFMNLLKIDREENVYQGSPYNGN